MTMIAGSSKSLTGKRTILLSPTRTQQQQTAPMPVIQFDDLFNETDSETQEESIYEEESEEEDEPAWEAQSPVENFTEAHEQHNASTEAGPSVPKNKFMIALTSAAQAYAARFRSHQSTTLLTPPSPLRQPLLDDLKLTTPEFSEDDSDNESSFSSEDEYDNTLFMDRPNLSKKDAMKLLYSPSEPWSSMSSDPIENPVVIAKLHSGIMCDASIKRGTLRGRRITYVSKTWSLTQTWRGFFSELMLYSESSYLRDLQGTFIPRLIGLYSVDGAVSVAMELPSSSFWVEASEDMSNHLKRKCIAAFDAIHAQGVLHNDVELRHMLISAEGRVTIIDFQESRALSPMPLIKLEQATEDELRLEKRKIKFKLAFEDSRPKEYEKQARVLGRQAKLAKRNEQLRRGQPVDPIESIEPEHPDDIVDPVVNSTVMTDCWIGLNNVEPECYIVPGQDETTVNAAIQEFLGDELDRQESDKSRMPSSSAAPTCQLSAAATLPQEAPDASTPQLNTPSPSPPTSNNKRKREQTEGDEDVSSFPIKKIMVAQARDPDPSSPSTNVPLKATTPELIDCLPPDEHPDNMTDVLYVPFEGYDGLGGFTIPNIYSAREVAEMRRTWIIQYNVERCKEEGLPYPLSDRFDLTPNSMTPEFDRDRTGKKKKRRAVTSRGAMKRAQIETENPGERWRKAEKRKMAYLRQRHVPGTGLTDSEDEVAGPSHPSVEEDGIPEGPKIIQWSALPESERSRSSIRLFEPVDLSTMDCHQPSSKFMAPKKGILRRQLSPDTKAKQREYDAWLKKHMIEESEGEDDDNLPIVAPTEENLKKLNAPSSKRSGKRRAQSPSGSSDDSVAANAVAGPSRLRSSIVEPPSSPSPRSRARGREGKFSPSKQKGKQKQRRDESPASDVASDGIDDDTAPSSSRASRETRDPFDNTGRSGSATVSPQEWQEMADVENLVKVNERGSKWSWLTAIGSAIIGQYS